MANKANQLFRYIKIRSPEQLEAYKFRQSCSHKSIPNFKILSYKQNTIYIKVQVCQKKLKDYLKSIQNQQIIIQIIYELISATDYIRSKIGCFAVSQEHLKIGQDGKCKVWAHEDHTSIFRQIPLPNQKSGQRAMLKSILAIFTPFLNKYRNLIKNYNFEDLKEELKKTLIYQNSQIDLSRRLTLQSKNKSLLIKTTKCLNLSAVTQRKSQIYIGNISEHLSPRKSLFDKQSKIQSQEKISSFLKNKFYENNSSKKLLRNYKKNIHKTSYNQPLKYVEESRSQINCIPLLFSSSKSTQISNDSEIMIGQNKKSNIHLKMVKKAQENKLSQLHHSLFDEFNNLFSSENHNDCQFEEYIAEELQNDFNHFFA